jgi:hypothetical protein
MNSSTQPKNATILPVLIALMLGCFGLSPQARAVCQEGCDTINSNTFLGDDALVNNNTGSDNTATGFQALFSNTTGFQNTATGFQALFSNVSGDANTATGFHALFSNTTGSDNTANGFAALFSNTTGIDNTANGFLALISNTTGFQNTASGAYALYSNTTGFDNTANGASALFSNTTGFQNTASGLQALFSNTTGNSNTATGLKALERNTIGSGNTASGIAALRSNTQGRLNTATGEDALLSNATGNNNTAIGVGALASNITGSGNVALGISAGGRLTTGNNNIYIANIGLAAGESRTIRIGNDQNHSKTFIAGIRDVTTGNADAIPVVIDSAGQLGTLSSARRFKNDVKPMEQSSEAILGLQPVTFHYKSDAQSTPQFGLIAEDVAEVNPDLVARDAEGEIYTVRYEAVNAMLLNEFLKEHRKVEQLEKQVAALTAGFRKVSAQLEVSKTAPQTVANNQ